MKLHTVVKANIRQLMFVFASFLLMVIVSCLFMNRIVRSEISAAALEMLSRTEISVYSTLREVEISALNISVDLQDRLDAGQSPEEIEAYLTRLNHEINASDERATALMSVSGWIKNAFRSSVNRALPADYDPKTRPWYKAARAANGRIAFTGPYVDLRTGENVVSFSKSLRSADGEDFGVLVLDLDPKALWENVASLQFENGGCGMILDADGNIVAHPDKNLMNSPLGAVGEGYAQIAERIRAGEVSISAENVFNFSGKRMFAVFQRMQNGLYVGIALPMSNYYSDMYLMAAALILPGVASMAVIDCFLLRLSMEKLHSEEENAGKSSFLAKMSHEIRTPLNSILGMSELVLRKDIPRDLFEYVSIIRQAGNNLLAIINDILDFSKIEAGQLEIGCEKYSFASLINDVVNVIRVRLLDKPVVFSVKADSNIPDVLMGDEVRVRQILLNLLGNAVKYTQEGHISLDVASSEEEGGNVRLIFRIEDSGVGIRESDLGKLFRDFTRINVPHDREVEGTGLGLVISRSLCRSMGGDISVQSEYGKGSVFTAVVLQARGGTGKLAFVEKASEKRVLVYEDRPICLDALVCAMTGLGIYPVCAQNPAEFKLALTNGDYDFAFISSRYAADCAFALGGSKSPTVLVSMIELGEVVSYKDAHSITMPIFCTGVANILNNTADHAFPCNVRRAHFLAPDVKVLIVDDISTNLRVSKELMALYGMDIHTCLSGAEAIELVRANRYDIVFMDHMMPDMDGVETAAAIRAIDKNNLYYQNIPIIALTANAVAGQREMFLQSGMNGFLAKPIEMQKLDAVLNEWIPESRRRETEVTANGVPETERLGFFEIEGVSIETGLRNSGGSVAAYADILMDFCRDAEERAEQIEQCLREENIGLYLTLVHALKGAARSVGAAEFAEFAARMEEAAQNGDAEVIDAMTGKLLAALRKLTNEIRTALDDRLAGDAAQPSDRLSAAQLTGLKSALADMDIATVNERMLAYAGLSLDPKTRKELSEIERLILLFEYDAAVRRIDLLIGATPEI
ncbi:MAG: response regulator [Clostridiales Family XIII bacterium]|jgi:signal transduction histidine kinase/CheY-like chemotaxis protein|nr:response regulator [Clostridiales Family XIII bacterium]